MQKHHQRRPSRLMYSFFCLVLSFFALFPVWNATVLEAAHVYFLFDKKDKKNDGLWPNLPGHGILCEVIKPVDF